MDPILKEQFNKLPQSIKNLIVSDVFRSDLKTISTNRQIINKDNEIENEVVFILLGLEPLGDFEKTLVDEVELTKEQAHGLVGDVFEKIITPIEEDLRNFLEKELQEESDEEDREIERIEKEIPSEEVKEEKLVVGDSSQGIVSTDQSSSQKIVPGGQSDKPETYVEKTPRAEKQLLKTPDKIESIKKEGVDTNSENMRKLLRENSKTVSIRNLLENLE